MYFLKIVTIIVHCFTYSVPFFMCASLCCQYCISLFTLYLGYHIVHPTTLVGPPLDVTKVVCVTCCRWYLYTLAWLYGSTIICWTPFVCLTFIFFPQYDLYWKFHKINVLKIKILLLLPITLYYAMHYGSPSDSIYNKCYPFTCI